MNNNTCPNCHKPELYFMASVYIHAPMGMWGNLTKRNLRLRKVEIDGVGWDRARIYCKNCGWQSWGNTIGTDSSTGALEGPK